MRPLIHRADLATLWLLGNPVDHSLSPLIQNTALAKLGRPVLYLASAVTVEDFESVVRALPGLGALGANVTVPHKEAAYSLCDQLSERARSIGAVNVFRFQGGQILGDNTDGIGWATGLMAEYGGQVCQRPAVVVGAGGAARAVVDTLCRQGCPRVTLLNRTRQRAEALKQSFSNFPCQIRVEDLERFSDVVEPGVLVVQTTSVGLKDDRSPVTLPSQWPEGAVCSDLIYGKKTRFIQEVRGLGGPLQDGLSMLCHQAAHGLALWLDIPSTEVPVEAMMEAALAQLDGHV